MEIEISDTPPEGMVNMWRLEDKETGELIAAVTLQVRDHVYTLGDLAVRGDRHSEGYGKIMQQVVFDAAKKWESKKSGAAQRFRSITTGWAGNRWIGMLPQRWLSTAMLAPGGE